MLVSNTESDFTFKKLLTFRYKDTYGTMTSENLEHFVAIFCTIISHWQLRFLATPKKLSLGGGGVW